MCSWDKDPKVKLYLKAFVFLNGEQGLVVAEKLGRCARQTCPWVGAEGPGHTGATSYWLPKAGSWRLFPAPCSATSRWQCEINHGGNIHTTISDNSTNGLFPPPGAAWWTAMGQHWVNYPYLISKESWFGIGITRGGIFLFPWQLQWSPF